MYKKCSLSDQGIANQMRDNFLSGQRESNPPHRLGKPGYYRCTMTALIVSIFSRNKMIRNNTKIQREGQVRIVLSANLRELCLCKRIIFSKARRTDCNFRSCLDLKETLLRRYLALCLKPV